MRRSRVAIGSERPIAVSRTPASSCCGASARSPPTTIAPGLKKLMHSASTSPTARPAAAHGLQRERLARARVRDDVADRRAPAARPPTGSPPARRRPRPPPGSRCSRTGRATSSWPASRMWPMSPAAPCAPAVHGAAGHDAALDARADVDVEQWSTSRQCVQCSPSAITLTWLSTSTGAGSARRTSPGSRSPPSRASCARRRARRGRSPPAPAPPHRYPAHARARYHRAARS